VMIKEDPHGGGSASASLILVEHWTEELKRLVPLQ
jgi:hypothetical protein